jgi:hypothetical protein
MTEWIFIIILAVFSALMFITSLSLLMDWSKTMDSWKSMPPLGSIINSLIDGIMGASGVALSSMMITCIVLTIIHMFTYGI